MIWKLIRSVTTTLLGLLLIGGAVGSIPFFIPPESYHSVIEHLLSDGLAREVRIRELRYRLFPFPHIAGSGISIASHGLPGEAVIKQVDLSLDLNALLRGNVAIKRAHFSGIAANQEFIEGFAESVNFFGRDAGAAPIRVARVTASTVMVRDRTNRVHGPFFFDGHFGGQSNFERMRLAMDDESLIFDFTPLSGALEVHARGYNVKIPGLLAVPIKRMEASAVLTKGTLHITQFSLQALSGWAEGNLRLHWSDAGSVIEGRSHVQGISLSELRRWTRDISLAGKASGLLEFTVTGASLADLPKTVAVVADVSVEDGSVAVDTALIDYQRISAQVTLTSQVTGKPNWATLIANARLHGEVTTGEGKFSDEGRVFAFTQLGARGEIDRHATRLERMEATAYGGTLQVSDAEISWRDTPRAQGRLITKNVAVGPLLAFVTPDNHLSGAVTAEIDFALSATEWKHLFTKPQIDGRATMHRVVVRNPGFGALPVKAGSPWLTLREVNLSGRYTNDAITLTGAEIFAYDGKLSATDLTLSWQEGWLLRARVQAAGIPINRVLARLREKVPLDGLFNADGNLTLAAPEFLRLFDHPSFEGAVTITDGRVSPAAIASAPTSNTGDWVDVFERVTVQGAFSGQRLEVAALDMRTRGGHITSENAVIDWNSGWFVSGPIAVSAVQIGPLLRPFLTENLVTGELNAQLRTKLQAPTLAELTDSIGLTGDFYISDGAIFKGDLGKANTPGLSGTDGSGVTRFQVLSGSVAAKTGTVRVRNLHLESDSLTADGELQISPKRRLSGTLAVASKGTGPFTIPLIIGGTVENPQYSLSRGAMVGSAMGTTIFGPGFGTLIGMQAGRLFSVLGSLFSHNKEKIERERAEEEL